MAMRLGLASIPGLLRIPGLMFAILMIGLGFPFRMLLYSGRGEVLNSRGDLKRWDFRGVVPGCLVALFWKKEVESEGKLFHCFGDLSGIGTGGAVDPN